jgi:hypothetical protein
MKKKANRDEDERERGSVNRNEKEKKDCAETKILQKR